MTKVLIALSIIVFSCGLGDYLDAKGYMRSPCLFWLMGVVTGFIALFVGVIV